MRSCGCAKVYKQLQIHCEYFANFSMQDTVYKLTHIRVTGVIKWNVQHEVNATAKATPNHTSKLIISSHLSNH